MRRLLSTCSVRLRARTRLQVCDSACHAARSSLLSKCCSRTGAQAASLHGGPSERLHHQLAKQYEQDAPGLHVCAGCRHWNRLAPCMQGESQASTAINAASSCGCMPGIQGLLPAGREGSSAMRGPANRQRLLARAWLIECSAKAALLTCEALPAARQLCWTALRRSLRREACWQLSSTEDTGHRQARQAIHRAGRAQVVCLAASSIMPS